ncbi:hypothetical protein EOD40_12120 [Flavobacterium sufflavum]|uniref:DUF3300 domain-containing protein n=1 Tax=Flavobacterium sufflavum TaxID=1921138 RepID=A0A437KS74_9FLAO|nr:hypothetical protein [Flavobacterium sufflavum]RVT74912.1 hypothetical protein EOD40_12120 [Flavobacterium sufflavum]
MKTLKLIATGIILFAASTSQAQVSINVNIGTPAVVVRPAWVPQNHVNVDFYYIPEIESYYDVSAGLYVYLDNGNWCRTRYVPVRYRGCDLNNARRIELRGYHGSRPYTYYNNHNVRYYDNRNYNTRYVEGRRYNNNRYADNYRSYDRRDDRNDRYDRDDRHDRGNHNGHRNH